MGKKDLAIQLTYSLVLQLISHRGTPDCQITGSQSDGSIRASITPPPDRQAPSPAPTSIYVQISLQKELRPRPVPTIRFIENDCMNPHIIKLSPRPYVDPKIKVSTGSILTYLSATVEFPSPYALVLQSTFLVYLNDSPTPLHSEIAPLKCLSSPMQPSGWLYSSEIAPDFWDTLCSSSGKLNPSISSYPFLFFFFFFWSMCFFSQIDLTQYTILQYLKPIPAAPHFDSNVAADSTNRTVFIAYKFGFQEPAIQTSFNTVIPSTYPVSYPTPALSHNQVSCPLQTYLFWTAKFISIFS